MQKITNEKFTNYGTLFLTTNPPLIIFTAMDSEARAYSEWNAYQSRMARKEVTDRLCYYEVVIMIGHH